MVPPLAYRYTTNTPFRKLREQIRKAYVSTLVAVESLESVTTAALNSVSLRMGDIDRP